MRSVVHAFVPSAIRLLSARRTPMRRKSFVPAGLGTTRYTQPDGTVAFDAFSNESPSPDSEWRDRLHSIGPVLLTATTVEDFARGLEEFVGHADIPAGEFIEGQAAHVSGLRAPDTSTLVVELDEPLYTFRYVMAMAFTCAVPRDLVRQFGKEFQDHMVGSGPYRLTERRRGILWRMERNPYYTGQDGFVDGIEVMIGPDRTTIAMMIERGEMDLNLAEIPTAAAFKRNPRLHSWLDGFEIACTQSFFLNNEIKPFDNVLVRRAVAHAINKERILRFVGGWGKVARTVVPTSMPWSNPDCPAYDYSPDRARQLLAQESVTLGGRDRDRQHLLHVSQGRAPAGHEAMLDVEHYVASDDQVVVERQGVEREVHHALDRVLDRHEPDTDLAGGDGVENVRHRPVGDQLTGGKVRLGAHRLLGERPERPEEPDPLRRIGGRARIDRLGRHGRQVKGLPAWAPWTIPRCVR
jgi:hypothetical protein